MSREYKDLVKGKLTYVKGYVDCFFDEENNHILDIRGWGRLLSENNDDGTALEEQETIANEILKRINVYEELEAKNAELHDKINMLNDEIAELRKKFNQKHNDYLDAIEMEYLLTKKIEQLKARYKCLENAAKELDDTNPQI